MDNEHLVNNAKVVLLNEAGVEEWDGYLDAIDDINDGADDWDALDNNGVDDWDGYDDALEILPDYEEYVVTNQDPVDFLEWRSLI